MAAGREGGSLVNCTRAKLHKYKELLNSGERRLGFWDVVVVTARDDFQKKIYDSQITLKIERQEIPSFVKYVVISDPPGVKVGSGGSTLHCLEHMLKIFGNECLNYWKVLVIHAGGFSQRLPHQSVLGKVFLTLPCELQMLDALLMMYIDIPEKMNSGVFIAASDVIFLYNEKGMWDFRAPGFTAITHPASIKLAPNHGVFILEDMEGPWKKYNTDRSLPAVVSAAKRFVHKETEESLIEMQARIPETDLVYVDLAYYFDVPTAIKLVKFYADSKPLRCEIDAYGDFLRPLGSAANADYSRASTCPDRARVQEELFGILIGTPLKVVIFHEAQFNHLGTISEFLYHIFQNAILKEAYQFTLRSIHSGMQDGSSSKKIGHSSPDQHAVVNSILPQNRLRIEANSIIEYCIIEGTVSIGRNCLLSNLEIPDNAVIPSDIFMHTLTIQIQDEVLYVTSVFGIHDDPKRKMPRSCALHLEFLHVPLMSALRIHDPALKDLWPQECDCNLWTAKLFAACTSRKESCQAAISLIAAIREKSLVTHLRKYSKFVSMEDVMVLKSSIPMLDYQSMLKEV